MKKTKITFWITTTIIFLFEGVLTALTFWTPFAQQGITSLGYPIYFGTLLAAFKVLGTLSLMIPKVPGQIKEWAYAGFGFDFIFAFVSIVAVGGFSGIAVLPLVFIVLLILSYKSYHKLHPAIKFK
jgi:hypothetical protein